MAVRAPGQATTSNASGPNPDARSRASSPHRACKAQVTACLDSKPRGRGPLGSARRPGNSTPQRHRSASIMRSGRLHRHRAHARSGRPAEAPLGQAAACDAYAARANSPAWSSSTVAVAPRQTDQPAGLCTPHRSYRRLRERRPCEGTRRGWSERRRSAYANGGTGGSWARERSSSDPDVRLGSQQTTASARGSSSVPVNRLHPGAPLRASKAVAGGGSGVNVAIALTCGCRTFCRARRPSLCGTRSHCSTIRAARGSRERLSPAGVGHAAMHPRSARRRRVNRERAADGRDAVAHVRDPRADLRLARVKPRA